MVDRESKTKNQHIEDIYSLKIERADQRHKKEKEVIRFSKWLRVKPITVIDHTESMPKEKISPTNGGKVCSYSLASEVPCRSGALLFLKSVS